MCKYFKIFIIYFLPGCFLFSKKIIAQQTIPVHLTDSLRMMQIANAKPCSNDMILEQLRKDPEYRAKEEKMNREILNASLRLTNDILTLPVVVHIINDNPNSITNLQIINGIKDLNDAFGKTGAYSASLGADTKIRFCLAKKDPEGGITTGITRTQSFFSNNLNSDNEDFRMKNMIKWESTQYINIYLLKNIVGEAIALFSCGIWTRINVGGYATMPPNAGFTDGIVVTGFGIVLAHEMGHYLGLYHTFEGSCFNNDCTLNGDRVCDTPPDGSLYSSPNCNSPSNSCPTDTLSNYSNGFFPKDVPDQISNFMDYGNPGCSNQFTQGQADRMRAAIQTQRSGLLMDKCTAPCTENIIAGFTRNIAYPLPGELISFTNTSSGASNYQWILNGIVVSTNVNFSFTFTSTGKNKVTLKAFNTSSCFSTTSDFVIVTCGVTARFYTNKKMIASKINILTDSITFTNNSYNAQSYQWLMSNNMGMIEQVVSTNPSFTYVFLTPANYIVKLVANNGGCSDTTDIYSIPVLDPTPDGYPYYINLFCYQQDKVRVNFCIGNSGYAPLAANTPVSFYNGDPSLPTTKKLSPTYYLPNPVLGLCGNCYTQILDVPYRGLERIYVTFNDSGISVPVLLPNTTQVEKFYLNNTLQSQPVKTTINTSICQGTSYQGYKVAGTYIDTLASIINGCDSVRTLNLAIRPVASASVSARICNGENYAGHTTSGTFVDVYPSVNGCDSTRTLNLTVESKFNTLITASICQGENFEGYTTSGTHIDSLKSLNGCDSIRTIALTVKPLIVNSLSVSICPGENYAGYNSAGTYVDIYKATNGCDSTRTLILSVKPIIKTSVNAIICERQDYANHTTPGTYVDTYKGVNGCDSIRTLNLSVLPGKFIIVDKVICEGESYFAGGRLQTKAGVYVDSAKNYLGCDSIITTNLSVDPKPYPDLGIDRGVCFGDILTLNPGNFLSYLWQDGNTASNYMTNKTGLYSVTVTNSFGCKGRDTMILLQVYPLPAYFLPPDSTLCKGNILHVKIPGFVKYNWSTGASNNAIDITSAGTYGLQVIDKYGCVGTDSILVQINNCFLIQIPNAFTPNADKLNDIFKPVIPSPISEYSMRVWNRWGQLVFETKDPSKGWDGTIRTKPQPSSTYVYLISLKDLNGEFIQKSGIVVLVR